MTSLSFGDAFIVAMAGGVGTLFGGVITAVIAYRTKLLETRAGSLIQLVEARRRQGERQAELAQQLLTVLTDCQSAVFDIRSRLDSATAELATTRELREFRGRALSCILLASRVVAKEVKTSVVAAVELSEDLLVQRSPERAAQLQGGVEEAFRHAGDVIATAVSDFEALAVVTQ